MKRNSLHAAIRKALAGASSKRPVDTATLYKLGSREQVKVALLELYQAQQACCCKFIKGGRENIVWWLAGDVLPQLGHSRMCAPKKAAA